MIRLSLKKFIQSALILALIALTGCVSNENKGEKSSSDKALSDQKVINIVCIGNTMQEIAFEPARIEVKPNETVHIRLINQSTAHHMFHNFVLVPFGKAAQLSVDAIKAGSGKQFVPDESYVIFGSDLVEPQKTIEFSFQAPAPGNYQYVCTYPGHALKMRGLLVVK